MRVPRPRAVQFQISVKARVPRGLKLPRSQYVSQVVADWANGDSLPDGWKVKVNVWEHGKERSIEPSDDARGSILRATLARALQERRLTIKEMGRA